MEKYETWELVILSKLTSLLEQSNIVWPKYGTQTTLELAEELYKEMRKELRDVYPEVPHF